MEVEVGVELAVRIVVAPEERVWLSSAADMIWCCLGVEFSWKVMGGVG